MLLAVACIVLPAAFWAEDFYLLWIGEKFLSGTPFPSVALLMRILLISVVATYATSIGSQILLGSERVRLLSISVTCEAGCSLIMSLMLIRTYGLIGIAASIVFSSVIVRLIVIPIILQRELGLPFKDYLRSICGKPSLVCMLLCVLILGIRFSAGRPGDWLHMIMQGGLFGVGAVVVVLGAGVTAEERERFLWQPGRRLLRRNNYEPVTVKSAQQPDCSKPV
jgi:O-antigen/teichoic acid export membrane protein